MCPPFAQILCDFLNSQVWVRDADGFFIYELHLLFVAYTRWMVPVNIVDISQQETSCFTVFNCQSLLGIQSSLA